MAKRYKSDALAAAHETALGLTEAGVMAKRTMRVFDDLCLTPVEDMTPDWRRWWGRRDCGARRLRSRRSRHR